jgi:hypothetical protein
MIIKKKITEKIIITKFVKIRPKIITCKTQKKKNKEKGKIMQWSEIKKIYEEKVYFYIYIH